MVTCNKIFGIGLSRTGTTSLGEALNFLGIRTIHWPTSMDDICRYTGAVDITVACRFRELEAIFPNSLFIYTERAADPWLRSVTEHYEALGGDLALPEGQRQFAQEADFRIYGSLRPGPTHFRTAYARHHSSVLAYFESRRGQLLRMNISNGDGWKSLCNFLDVPTPRISFPHLNTAARARGRTRGTSLAR